MARNGKDNETVWLTIDMNDVSKAVRKAYEDYREVQALANEARKEFEKAYLAAEKLEAPAGKRFAFGYRFGKASIALVTDDKRPAAKPKMTLAEYLAAHR